LSAAFSPSLAKAFAAAAEVLARVIEGESLTSALAELKRAPLAHTLVAAAQDLCYNALRGYGVVDVIIERLVDRPTLDARLRALLIAACAELAARPRAAHAVVHQAVEATAMLGISRAKGMVNAVLRNFQRRMQPLMSEIETTDVGRYRHPQWWIDTLRNAYPSEWESVLLESNRHPPMTLRVNRRRISAAAYVESLGRAQIAARCLGSEAVLLEKPCRVQALPGFEAGDVSVQDAGAQVAAHLLDLRHGMRVLDACAAPGGKTGHILELAECSLTAIDVDTLRAGRIAENLSRLGLKARILVGDCRDPASFWDGAPFDRILLDAPCSSSGVVRRHPDIKWLRRQGDIANLVRVQSQLLDSMWRMLGVGGKLLYATCSLFPEENEGQLLTFVERHPDAKALPVKPPSARPEAGQGGPTFSSRNTPFSEGQMLTNSTSDGFYYALLEKTGGQL
jgi:16S rRNA (cytosine967-C5)-methyltransferase